MVTEELLGEYDEEEEELPLPTAAAAVGAAAVDVVDFVANRIR